MRLLYQVHKNSIIEKYWNEKLFTWEVSESQSATNWKRIFSSDKVFQPS